MTTDANNKTHYLVPSQLPGFVRNDHPRFVEFLELYYKYLDMEGNVGYLTKNFSSYLDVDILEEDIKEHLEEGMVSNYEQWIKDRRYQNYSKYFPVDSLGDRNQILKHIKDFYRAAGTEKSVNFLLRSLFNKEADIYYPKDNILKASDGKWFIQKTLNIRDVAVNNVANISAYHRFVNTTIRGATSNSTCIVESVNQYFDAGVLINEFTVSGVEQDFINGELLFTTIEDEGVPKFLSGNLFSGSITSVTIENPGSGYIQGAAVPIENPPGFEGITGQLIITKVGNPQLDGKVKAVVIEEPGSGFRVGDEVLFTGGGGRGAAGVVSAVNEDESFHVSNMAIVGTRIIDVANTPIGNSTNSIYEAYAYPAQSIVSSNTSNLTINVGGAPENFVTTITLNQLTANSNTYFEINDTIQIYDSANAEEGEEGVIISESSNHTVSFVLQNSNTVLISPGVSGAQNNLCFIVHKRGNAFHTLANTLTYWNYGPTGPLVSIAITNPGSGYIELPSVDIKSNTIVRSLGILGRMEIANGGFGYANGDIISFINPPGSYGFGANAKVDFVDANGTIQQISFYPLEGHNEGGLGYNPLDLPTAVVISANANAYGAVINVASIFGDNERVVAESNVIGSIETIKIISGGIGYEEAPTLNLKSQGDGTAQVFCNIITGIFTYPGRYLNDDGQLSSYNFLQDRDYYQNFSYVIRIDESIEKYRTPIKDMVHPAGMKLWSEYIIVNNDQANTGLINIGPASYSPTTNSTNAVLYLDVGNTISMGTIANTYANIGNIVYYSSNSWFNAVNTAQRAVLSNGAYFLASGVWMDGFNDNVTVQHANTYNVGNLLTVMTWVNSANNRGFKNFVYKTDSGQTRGFRFGQNANTIFVQVYPDNEANNYLEIGTFQSNGWYHIGFTFDGSKIRGYVNGAFTTMTSFGNVTTGFSDSDGDIFIGGQFGTEANSYRGQIASVRMYDRVLGNNEIVIDYNTTRKRFAV
jgi:hypothetical protein